MNTLGKDVSAELDYAESDSCAGPTTYALTEKRSAFGILETGWGIGSVCINDLQVHSVDADLRRNDCGTEQLTARIAAVFLHKMRCCGGVVTPQITYYCNAEKKTKSPIGEVRSLPVLVRNSQGSAYRVKGINMGVWILR